jgi:hypothetical protein
LARAASAQIETQLKEWRPFTYNSPSRFSCIIESLMSTTEEPEKTEQSSEWAKGGARFTRSGQNPVHALHILMHIEANATANILILVKKQPIAV